MMTLRSAILTEFSLAASVQPRRGQRAYAVMLDEEAEQHCVWIE